MVQTHRNVNVAVNVERFSEALSEYVDDIIVAIRAVVELDTKRALPFLGLQDVLAVGSVEEKAFLSRKAVKIRLSGGQRAGYRLSPWSGAAVNALPRSLQQSCSESIRS